MKDKCLFVDPRLLARSPGSDAFREPEGNFLLGRFDGIGSVADVASNFDAVISANGSRSRVTGHGGSKHFASFLYDTGTFPDHGADGSTGHVGNETGEEFLFLEVFVVLFHVFLTRGGQLHGDQLVSLLFETLDDFSNESTLDAIGLDHNVCEEIKDE